MKLGWKNIGVIIPIIALAACSDAQVERLKWVGKEPPRTAVNNPAEQVNNVTWPARKAEPVPPPSVNSLWSQNSRAFFMDQRARHIGDILTVNVEIKDKAKLDNKTERKRDSSDSTGATVFGLEKLLTAWLPGKADPENLLGIDSQNSSKGEGKIDRKEDIQTSMAAVITQILPNGNMVIYGSQEITVNYEMRELTVEGVVRPVDIKPDNSVDSTRIAEARISYAGKGVMSDIQQPRVGNQIVDIVSPW